VQFNRKQVILLNPLQNTGIKIGWEHFGEEGQDVDVHGSKYQVCWGWCQGGEGNWQIITNHQSPITNYELRIV
jgi:hypothetical protein